MAELLPELVCRLPAEDGAHPGMLDPRVFFPRNRRAVWLEIGFGSGELLAQLAGANRDIGYIGVEIYVNGIAGLLARLAADPSRALDNIRLFTDDGLNLVQALRNESVARLLIPFPDPWPKARHRKRRLIGPHSAAEFARVLAPGGRLEIASDDASYVDWIVEHLGRCPGLRWEATRPEDWRTMPEDWVETRYAIKAAQAGRKGIYLRFSKALTE